MGAQLKKWTVEEYERLVTLGALTENDRVQLVQGEIVQMSPQNAPHMTAVHLIYEALRSLLPPGFTVRVQGPLTLAPDSEPEPDVAVVRGSPRDYRDRHPGGDDTALVVEVADTTLSFDRERKGRVYAGAGIPEYWILNLNDRELEVYREPEAGEYRTRAVLREGDTVTPSFRPDARISLADLLP